MMIEVGISMLAAAVIIAMIILSSGSRMYFRKKFDVKEHFEKVDEAVQRQQSAKRMLHHAQNK